MTLVVPDTGEVLALTNFLNKAAAQDQKLRLYSNNITPAESDTTATYTEVAWTGYAAISLTGTSWTVTGGAPTSAAYAQQTFTSSANQSAANNYGYYVNQTTSTTLMWSERVTGAPYVIQNNGDNIQITPTITMD